MGKVVVVVEMQTRFLKADLLGSGIYFRARPESKANCGWWAWRRTRWSPLKLIPR